VRGSQKYVLALVGKVKPTIEHKRPPTIFITASCAEWYSQEYEKHLRDINSHLVVVNKMTVAELTAMDPVSGVVHFDKMERHIQRPYLCKVESCLW